MGIKNRLKMSLNVGDAVTDFSLVGHDFKAINFSDFKGKKLILAFFPAAFSGAPDDGCEMQLCGINQFSKDFSIIGVSKDVPFALNAFKSKISLDFPLACDPTGKTCEMFVGNHDFGAFLDKVGVTTNFAGFSASNRGCVIIGEDGKIIYKYVSEHVGVQPPLKEIKAALGI